ncbi:unnamed protein product [Lepidochelys kempii]
MALAWLYGTVLGAGASMAGSWADSEPVVVSRTASFWGRPWLTHRATSPRSSLEQHRREQRCPVLSTQHSVHELQAEGIQRQELRCTRLTDLRNAWPSASMPRPCSQAG